MILPAVIPLLCGHRKPEQEFFTVGQAAYKKPAKNGIPDILSAFAPVDLCTELLQPDVDLFIPTVDLVDVIDDAGAFG